MAGSSEQEIKFFDASSTTPVDSRILEKMIPYFDKDYGNPSSHIHSMGISAGRALEKAREQVSNLINSKKEEIYFNSGATEGNNLAILGYLKANPNHGKHIIISEIEHFSVLNISYSLMRQGYDVTCLPVDKFGLISPTDLQKAVRPDTSIISIQHANPEIGTIQRLAELAAIASKGGIYFHSDSTAGAGTIPMDINEIGADSMTLSAHNYYGPKGVGALYVKKNIRIAPLFEGGFQESGIRPGTENLPGIVGMGEASELAKSEIDERIKHLLPLRRRLWEGLAQKIEYIHFTGHPDQRLPGHVSFWIEFVEGESLQLMLSMKGIMAASGSACSSNLKGKDEKDLAASHVLTAVGVPAELCSGSLTFHLLKDACNSDVDYALEQMPPIVERLLSMSPLYADHLKKMGTSRG